MSMKDFEFNLANNVYSFSDSEIVQFKGCIYQLYKLMKSIFDRKPITRSISSAQAHKISREYVFDHPSDYYSFHHKDVDIYIILRRGGVYSVACYGFCPIVFNDIMENDKYEERFGSGSYIFGHYFRKDFSQVVKLFHSCIKSYFDWLDIKEC